MDSARMDRRACKRIIDQMLADVDRRSRHACLRFLADSIAYAASHWPDRWSVTLYSNYIRLNVGWVEALLLGPSFIAVMVTSSRLPTSVKLGRRYARAKGARLAHIPVAKAPVILRRLRVAHREAMRAAATWRTPIGTRSAHSPGVVEYLWRTLRRRTYPPEADSRKAHGPVLHIIQGGVENGDKRLLERAPRRGTVATNWVAPRGAVVGDDVVIYIGGYGLFATGKITRAPRPRRNWPNRYGAGVGAIRLVHPPISLEILRRSLPDLKWANYPRSIVTPAPKLAEKILALTQQRRRLRGADIDKRDLADASLDELRAAALAKSAPHAPAQQKRVTVRKREVAVKAYALKRAAGKCEFCREDAPFRSKDGKPYLESHHILRVSDKGPDHPRNVIGVCPNCHKRAHHAHDQVKIKRQMMRRVAVLERQATRGR